MRRYKQDACLRTYTGLHAPSQWGPLVIYSLHGHLRPSTTQDYKNIIIVSLISQKWDHINATFEQKYISLAS